MEDIDKKLQDLRNSIADNIIEVFHKEKTPIIKFDDPLYVSEDGYSDGEFVTIKILSVSLIEGELIIEYVANKFTYKDNVDCFSVNALYELHNKITKEL